jgi:hypothetical protein
MNIYFIFILSLQFILSITRRSLGQDCDGIDWCAQPYVCKDYRCSYQGTPDDQVAWGVKCDWFHPCMGTQQCVTHRCQ